MAKKDDLKRRLKQSARRRTRRPTAQPDVAAADKQACYDVLAETILKRFNADAALRDRHLQQALDGILRKCPCSDDQSEGLRHALATRIHQAARPLPVAMAACRQMLKDIERQRTIDKRATAFLEFLATVCR